jgi:hypothetical protein
MRDDRQEDSRGIEACGGRARRRLGARAAGRVRHHTLGSGKHAQSWFVADGKLTKDAKAMAGVRIYTAQPITSGVSMSDVYTERARIWGPRCSTPPCASYTTYLMSCMHSAPARIQRPRSSTSAGTC